jgi:hypothetical protein
MPKAIGLWAVCVLASAVPTQAWVSIAAPPSAEECCKVCHKGKACGNSCIARDKICHQPPGCACDG